jgi:hypothetical protein
MVRFRLLIAVASAFLVAGVSGCGDSASEPASSDEEGLDVVALVDDFMAARQQGLPADEFMSAKARAAYAEHEGGLWLHDDTLPGGPGGDYQEFSTEVSPGGDAWTAAVRTIVRWTGDAKPTDMVEELTIAGDKIVAAKRTDDPADGGLPTAVAETREAIYRAAVKQDYDALQALLDPETFSYSFGGSGDPIGYWREQEEAEIPLLGDVLPGVLHTRFGKNEDIYVWPSAAAKEASDWTRADLESMRDAGYANEDIESFKEFGGYTGWRAGIRADGTWLYFIAGD